MPRSRVHSTIVVATTPSFQRPWRVAITSDDSGLGVPLLDRAAPGLTLVACPVLVEAPPADAARLVMAAAELARYDWVVCASARSVAALRRAHAGPWPEGLRSAAVGTVTAAALLELGAAPPPVTAVPAGADALWAALERLDAWPTRRVLVLTTPGGRTTLADRFIAAGAATDVVDAYRMVPRPTDIIRRDWTEAAPNALIVGSPRAARTLADAVGEAALAHLDAVVAIGTTTADAVSALGVKAVVAPAATFTAALDAVARLQARRAAV